MIWAFNLVKSTMIKNLMSILLITLVFFSFDSNAKAHTDAKIKDILIEESINQTPGNCPCPYHGDRSGRRCGGRSSYSRGGGYAPLCYKEDISKSMIENYRQLHGLGKPTKIKKKKIVSKPQHKPELSTNPRLLIYQQKPIYPLNARRAQQKGTSRYELLVDTDGNVSSITIVESSGYQTFDLAGAEALKSWKYTPGTPAFINQRFIWKLEQPATRFYGGLRGGKSSGLGLRTR